LRVVIGHHFWLIGETLAHLQPVAIQEWNPKRRLITRTSWLKKPISINF